MAAIFVVAYYAWARLTHHTGHQPSRAPELVGGQDAMVSAPAAIDGSL